MTDDASKQHCKLYRMVQKQSAITLGLQTQAN